METTTECRKGVIDCLNGMCLYPCLFVLLLTLTFPHVTKPTNGRNGLTSCAFAMKDRTSTLAPLRVHPASIQRPHKTSGTWKEVTRSRGVERTLQFHTPRVQRPAKTKHTCADLQHWCVMTGKGLFGGGTAAVFYIENGIRRVVPHSQQQ